MRPSPEGTPPKKLRRIEAPHADTTKDWGREAARRAAERIRERLAALRTRDRDVEMV